MKRTLMITIISLTSAYAFAQTVICPDMVGYTKVDTIGGHFVLLGVPFMVGTENTVSEILGDSMPISSLLYTWNGSGYDPKLTYTYYGTITPSSPNPIYTTNGIGWVEAFDMPASTRVIEVGEGFFVRSVAFIGVTNEIIIVGGVVPDATVTNSIVPGLNMISSPYPVEVAITNFGFNPVIGDKIKSWDGTWYGPILEYTYYGTVTSGSPNPIYTTNGIGWVEAFDMPVTGLTIPAGEGFWYDSVAATTKDWVMERPFNLEP